MPWTLSLGVGASYETNALFTPLNPIDDYSNRLNGGISRSWRLRRGGASFFGTASQVFYKDVSSLDGLRYDLGGTFSHALTRRLQWAGSGTVSSGLARDARPLTDTGVLLPSVTTRSSSASSAFSYALSRDSQIDWTLAETGVGFASSTLNGGTSVTSTASWTTRVGRSQTIGATQDYSRTFRENDATDIYGFLGTWALTTGQWTVYASGGLRPYTVPLLDGFRFSGAFAAGVTKPVRQNQTVGISYSHNVEQTFAVAAPTRLLDTVSGNYSIALLTNLTASVSGTYTHGKSTLFPELKTNAQIAGATLDFRPFRHLSISGSATYYSRLEEPIARVTGTTTIVSANYVTSW